MTDNKKDLDSSAQEEQERLEEIKNRLIKQGRVRDITGTKEASTIITLTRRQKEVLQGKKNK